MGWMDGCVSSPTWPNKGQSGEGNDEGWPQRGISGGTIYIFPRGTRRGGGGGGDEISLRAVIDRLPMFPTHWGSVDMGWASASACSSRITNADELVHIISTLFILPHLVRLTESLSCTSTTQTTVTKMFTGLVRAAALFSHGPALTSRSSTSRPFRTLTRRRVRPSTS